MKDNQKENGRSCCKQTKTCCGNLDGTVFGLGLWNTMLLIWWAVTAYKWWYDSEKWSGSVEITASRDAMTDATVVVLLGLCARMVVLPLAYFKRAENLRQTLYYVWVVTWLLMVAVIVNNLV